MADQNQTGADPNAAPAPAPAPAPKGAAAKKPINYRVLVSTVIDGLEYGANQVIQVAPIIAEAYVKGGQLDAEAAAVEYAISIGAEVINHEEAVNASKAAAAAVAPAPAANSAAK